MSLVKWIARGICPPALWSAARACYRLARPVPAPPAPPLAPPPPWRTVSTLEEVDACLDYAAEACNISSEVLFARLDSFRLAPPSDVPADPWSPEYREYQMAYYGRISGRERYRAEECEQLAVTADAQQRPFPYYTRSTTIIGEQLMAMGYLIRALALPSGGRVLEFGPGFGRLTLELARSDFRVTAVEINPEYADLIERDADREGLEVRVVRSGMLDYRPQERFDCVVFYESFHHCDDHQAMVARLDGLVAPGGRVFGGEPILDDFPIPWGVRTDGRSLWAIRRFSWLELGFRTDYFLELLRRHGWGATVHQSTDVPWQRVFVARRAIEAG